MKGASIVALSQQKALRKQMEVCTDNLANAKTPGFQKEVLRLTESSHNKTLTHPISMVKIDKIERITTPGAITKTGNPFDIAIDGSGYFRIDTPDGERYTRNGQFGINSNNQIITAQGFPLSSGGSPIQIPDNTAHVIINEQGVVFADNNRIGTITAYQFENEQTLVRMGDGLMMSDQAPIEAQNIRFMQGAVVESNINMVEEIVHMIDIQRSYQAGQQLVDSEDERRRNSIDRIVKTA